MATGEDAQVVLLVLREGVQQAALLASGRVPVCADRGGTAQGGWVAGHDDLAARDAAVLPLGQVVAQQALAVLPDRQPPAPAPP
jgi:hypothetical protein